MPQATAGDLNAPTLAMAEQVDRRGGGDLLGLLLRGRGGGGGGGANWVHAATGGSVCNTQITGSFAGGAGRK